MTDYTELKRLAEATEPAPWYHPESHGLLSISGANERAFISAANPSAILALIAENERLTQIIVRKREDIAQYDQAFLVVAGQRDQLKAEVEALRKDAGRYRWLRDGAGYCDTRDIPGMAPARMDAFIDAALSKEAGHD